MQRFKQLPIGIQSFKKMIEDDFIYIDKTKHIYEIITTGQYYFLSRPRRFGKSLLISTLKELFSGNKKLFESTYIYKTDYAWVEHPIIHISFTSISSSNSQKLQEDLVWQLEEIAKQYNINLSLAPSAETKFQSLVKQLAKVNRVVILVDEYDYPILNNIQNIDLAKECRDVLKNFFVVIKDLDDYIRFVFVTGVTKFSKTSIFSGFNNLNDLTLSTTAAQLLGYTAEEIAQNFKPYVAAIEDATYTTAEKILENIRVWYNGYQFTDNQSRKSLPPKVYNPYSVLLYLSNKRLFNYWFETGTPSFLVHLIKTQGYSIDQIEYSEVNSEEVRSFEIDTIPLIPLLWQTGYLTIGDYNQETNNYTLIYPNEEVKSSFLNYFISYITTAKISFLANYVFKLTQSLRHEKLDDFFYDLKIFFANIPYTMQLSLEKYYQSIFYVITALIGAQPQAEVATNQGRIDATIETGNTIFIFEFKLNGSAQEALNQIREKKYYERYLNSRKKIMLIGVNFDTSIRNIENWIVQEYTLD